MAISGVLLLELAANAVCFVCGIVAAASLTVAQGEFSGHCLLYGTVTYNETSGTMTLSDSSSPSLCYFVSIISVIVALYCFTISLCLIYTTCVEGLRSRPDVYLNVTLVVCGFFVFFLLISGCILNVGRGQLCNSVLSTASVKSCKEAQDKPWMKPYDGSHFYTSLQNAETSVWVNFFLWLIIGILVIVQKCLSTSTGGERRRLRG